MSLSFSGAPNLGPNDQSPARSTISSLALTDPDDRPFDRLAADLVAQVDPRDPMGRLLAEMLLIAVERLRRATLLEPQDGPPELAWCRFQALAERNARSAIRELQRHQDRMTRTAQSASSSGPKARSKAGVVPDPEPVEPNPPAPPESTPEEIAEASTNWQRHIALVRNISDEWPIILRLRREVEDVTAWLAVGKSEEEMMRWYPGLTRADIAACRACDAAGLCGPFDTADGPYPPNLPVLDDLPDDP
jgi:uncharacterized protein (DUF433 family)